MRPYSPNSPEAAARVLAMALVADGHCDFAELRTLDQLGVPDALGLSPDRFDAVMRDFCEDLQLSERATWRGSATLDGRIRAQLLAEVTEAALRMRLTALCEAVVMADGRLTEDESVFLTELDRQWWPMARRGLLSGQPVVGGTQP